MRRTWLFRLAVVVGGLFIGALFAELALRIVEPARDESSDAIGQYSRCDDCGHIYEPNPEHPEISPQGLRQREYPIPKPAGSYRILFLGDSVVFGSEVPFDSTFIHLLERGFESDGLPVEAINAGVEGYTTYNELHYYLERGRLFEPDLVVVGFCLNDVVNPLLHWTQTRGTAFDVPEAAIPDFERHEAVILPRYESEQRRQWLAERSALFRLVDTRVLRRLERRFQASSDRQSQRADIDGEPWPTFLTLEDDLSIEVLTDYESVEWRWLREMLAQLQDAVATDGAQLAIVVFPLAYQLDDGYPFFPQEQWDRFCRESSLECLDLLPALREHGKHNVFQLEQSGYLDVWHFSEAGHSIVSEQVREFFDDRYLETIHTPLSESSGSSRARASAP